MGKKKKEHHLKSSNTPNHFFVRSAMGKIIDEEINQLQRELLNKYRENKRLEIENNRLKSNLEYYKSKRIA